MKKIIVILSMFMPVVASAVSENTDFVNAIISGDKWDVARDTIVSENSVISVKNININESLYFENRGDISGDFILCGYCDLDIRNSGSLSGVIYPGENSTVTQVIKSADDINRLGISGASFSISVRGDTGLRLTDIMDISAGATRIILDNTSIVLDGGARVADDVPVELVGEVTVTINNLNKSSDRLILSNVLGDGVVTIFNPRVDTLYLARAVRDGDNVIMDIYRQTDYYKIFDNRLGLFLNELRLNSPNNKTLVAMDAATDMYELNKIMDKSVMLNPINLMNPVKTFNNAQINSYKSVSKPMASSFDIEYILSDNSDIFSGRGAIAMSVGDFNFAVGGYFGRLKHIDDLNEFNGTLYGGNIRAFYNSKPLWIDVTAGFTISEFETDVIFNDGDITYNPDGLSIYGAIDVGSNFDFNGGYYIAPFVGVAGTHDKILNHSDTNIPFRAGTVAGFGFEEIGIRYDYQMFTIFQTDGAYSIGARMNIFSIADLMGGGISYTFNHDDFGTSHRFSLDVKFMI